MCNNILNTIDKNNVCEILTLKYSIFFVRHCKIRRRGRTSTYNTTKTSQNILGWRWYFFWCSQTLLKSFDSVVMLSAVFFFSNAFFRKKKKMNSNKAANSVFLPHHQLLKPFLQFNKWTQNRKHTRRTCEIKNIMWLPESQFILDNGRL